jgi:hypothetical protein
VRFVCETPCGAPENAGRNGRAPRSRLIAALTPALSLALYSAAVAQAIVVGAKDFTEQLLVAHRQTEERRMPKGEQRGNREAKKPKKEKPKTIAAAPSMKGTAGSSGGSKK